MDVYNVTAAPLARSRSAHSGWKCWKRRQGPSRSERLEAAKARWRRVATLRYVLSGMRQRADVVDSQRYAPKEFKETQANVQSIPKVMLYPWSPVRKVLDVVSSVLILYFCFATPFRAGFLSDETDPIPYELVFDGVLFLDLLSTFFTAYLDNYELILSYRRIALRYLKSSFLFDLISVIPFYIIQGDLMWLKIFRLLHMSRITNLLIGSQESLRQSFLDKLDWHTRRHVRSILLLMLYLCIACHVIACTWNYISVREEAEMEKTWTQGVPSSVEQSYVAALYWTIVTLATVGYGDVTAKTNPEFAFSMFVELIGILIFALCVGNITSIVSNMNMCEAVYSQQENDLEKWLEELEDMRANKRLDPKLYANIKDSLTYRWKKDHSALIMQSDYFFRLPEKLRISIGKTFFTDEVEKFQLFLHDTEQYFQYRLISQMYPRHFSPKSTIIESGITPTEFYFIDSGEVHLTLHSKSFLKFVTGSYFGEDYLLFNEPSQVTYR